MCLPVCYEIMASVATALSWWDTVDIYKSELTCMIYTKSETDTSLNIGLFQKAMIFWGKQINTTTAVALVPSVTDSNIIQ